MQDSGNEEESYPPGFEPPKDVNVPWYAWALWPLAILCALAATFALFRGCMSWIA
jgi:hypothetical protein